MSRSGGVAAAAAYPVVPVFHPRREARRALKRGYPRTAGSVRLCRSIQAVERLLEQRLVDAVVLDVRHCDGLGLTLPARFPRIPIYALTAGRPRGAAAPAPPPPTRLTLPPFSWRAYTPPPPAPP